MVKPKLDSLAFVKRQKPNAAYLKLLQTAASFIIESVHLDRDGDGSIELDEVVQLVTPIIFNYKKIGQEFQDFWGHFKNYSADNILKDLRNLIELQLLPDEFSSIESDVDDVMSGLLKVGEGVADVYKVVTKKRKTSTSK